MTLSPGQIHLWIRSLAVASQELVRVAGYLSEDEIQRSRRFRFDVHRNRFIAGRGRLREILAKYVGQQPEKLEFTYGRHGKPDLACNPNSLRFNLSHSADLAVYAISQAREIGVDVEQVRASTAEEQIPEMYFSPAEVRTLRSLPKAKQPEAFFRCWTRKEAYVKAKAEGLSIALDSFDVTLTEEDGPRFLRGGAGYSIYSFRVEPDFIGAVVAQGDDWDVLLK